MIKSLSALLLILISLSFMAPGSWAQPTCVQANGLLWCYNNGACGQACNDVCAALGTQPISDDTVWSQAQDSVAECQAISQAFGLGDTVEFGSFTFACLEDTPGPHSVGGGLLGPMFCSSSSGCPSSHRTGMDQQGIPCGEFSRRSICPCEQVQLTIDLSPLSATNSVLTDHTVTATVLSGGVPVSGVYVSFEVISGPNSGETSDPGSGECSPNDDCTTDGNGQVSWTYTSNVQGTDTIVASVGGLVESDPVEKIWVVAPIPTLSGWGLIITGAVLGVAGLMVIRRRKAAA
jgi:hypothetical protein